MSTDNSSQILDEVLRQNRTELAPELSDQEYFEVFCAEQILKDFDLSYDEINSGIVDGEHDGGVDSIYAFVNGELVSEDFDLSGFKKDVSIELHIIQSKTAGNFSEDPLNRLISLTRNLLRLDANFKIITQYNAQVKAAVDNFRSVYRGLASKFPSLNINYYYAAKRADGHIHQNLSLKAEELKSAAKELFTESDVSVEFLGSRRLLELARRRPKTTFELRVGRSLSATNGYVVLSNLTDYNSFLRGGGEKVKSELFESNVRDFQGDTEVNDEIVQTLKLEGQAEFWWMNNGVTILSSRATLNGDIVVIENPQIVNGLQTSTQIARFFDENKITDGRSLMVKIVSSDDEEVRDKIIKATNRQNAVQPATLRATDKIQRDIEQTLKSVGLYYDRRKNFYKNAGKPADRIISIPLMAQAVMSIILALPDSARARPSSLIKSKEDYNKVFSESFPITLYSNAGGLIRQIDRLLKSNSGLSARDRANMRFYVLYYVSALAVGSASPNASSFAKLDVKTVSDDNVSNAIEKVRSMYDALGATDQVAKGPDLRISVQQAVLASLKGTATQGQGLVAATGPELSPKAEGEG